MTEPIQTETVTERYLVNRFRRPVAETLRSAKARLRTWDAVSEHLGVNRMTLRSLRAKHWPESLRGAVPDDGAHAEAVA